MSVLAIDPGNTHSAYVLMDRESYKPIQFDIMENNALLEIILSDFSHQIEHFAIEMIASYGMPVGAEVFDTCVWIGRFWQRIDCGWRKGARVYRKDVKMNLCGTMKAKDANIRQALIDRFGDVGTKKAPGWFYGFKKDLWAAYAVGVTYIDKL